MKRKIAKSIILVLAIVSMMLACTLAIIGATENKTYTVTYYTNGNVSKPLTFNEGEKHRILASPLSSQQTDKRFYGWYDETGKFYKDIEITITENLNLYEAYGTVVNSEADLIKNITQAGNYIRLGASIALDEVVTLPANGLVILDLNGYNLNITSKDVAFKGTNASIHILNSGAEGKGKITHTGEASNADIMDSALFTLEPNPRRNVEIHLFNNASIETNVGLFDIVNDLTYSNYTYNFNIEGSVKANFLVRTYGIKNATFKACSTTVLDVTGQYVFEDRGNCEGINLTFEMIDGKLDIIENAFIVNELSKYNVYLTGGSYNRDFSNLYPNYTFTLGADERYKITACKHNDVAIGMTASCEEAGTITYQCTLCGVVRTEESGAIGHSVVKKLAQEAITTVEKTEPGYYSTICQRCGEEEREYFYPAPKDVYVTVKLRLDSGEIKEIRAKSTDLYEYDAAGDRLQSFSTSYLEFVYNVKQSNIISIEIPLGVKTIAGGIGTDNAYKGLFHDNTHLEEVILPVSIENIEATAFANIPTLKTVKGLEYVTGTIGTYAFLQTMGNNPYIERMELNAKRIEGGAFKGFKMVSLTFGEDVEYIGDNAFALGDGVTTEIKEIFIEGNTNKAYNGATLSRYNNDFKRFTAIGSGHQFDSLGIVYADHSFEITTTEATCQAQGFDFMKCTYCGEEKIDNYTDIVDHKYVTIDPPVPSTCSTQGYEGTRCTMCGDVRVSRYYDKDPNTHDYTYSTTSSLENTCEYDYHEIGVCICGKSDPNTSNWKYKEASGEHVWDENNPIEYVYPTCGKEGYSKIECISCGFIKENILKPTGKHMYITDNKNSIPATCKKEGVNAFVCDACGTALTRVDPIDPDNHEWEKDDKGNLVWTTKVAATAEKAGTAQNKCTGCDEIQTKGIPVTSEETKGMSTAVLVILIVVGSLLVLGGIGLTLYFTVFKKSASSGYKYKFNTLNKK